MLWSVRPVVRDSMVGFFFTYDMLRRCLCFCPFCWTAEGSIFTMVKHIYKHGFHETTVISKASINFYVERAVQIGPPFNT